MLTDEDKKVREGKITATRLVMITLGMWGGPMRAWLEIKGEETSFEDSYLMLRGRLMEPIMAELYSVEYGEKVREVKCTVHPNKDFICATADGLVSYGGEECVAEIKMPYLHSGYGQEDTDEVPDNVLVQTTIQMSCLGLQRAINIVDKQTKLARYIIDRSKNLETSLLAAAEDFWSRHVVRDIPPPVDESTVYKEYIEDKFRKHSGNMEAGNTEVETWMKEYLRIKNLVDNELAPAKKILRNKIMAYVGSSQGVYTDAIQAKVSRVKGSVRTDSKKLKELALGLGATDRQLNNCLFETRPHCKLNIKENLNDK